MINNQMQGVLALKGLILGNNISTTYRINYGSNKVLPSGLKNAPINQMGALSEFE